MNRMNYSEQVERAARQLEQYAQIMTGGRVPDLRPMLATAEFDRTMQRHAQAQARAYPPSVGKRR